MMLRVMQREVFKRHGCQLVLLDGGERNDGIIKVLGMLEPDVVVGGEGRYG